MSDPTARLLRSTRRRLMAVTLGLIALLIVGIGAATAFVGLRALDADVDRALAASVDAAVAALGGELPQGEEEADADETLPASSDTVVLYLDPTGKVLVNPSRLAHPGLPDTSALAAASASGRDLRTVDVGGGPVRLLTVPVRSEDGSPIGFVQGGFILKLHDAQSNSLVVAIVLVGAIGLIGAAIVTLVVTGDALGPDPPVVRRPASVRRRRLARAADPRRPHPGQRRGARARGARDRRGTTARRRHRGRVGPPRPAGRRPAPARVVRRDGSGPRPPAGRPGRDRRRHRPPGGGPGRGARREPGDGRLGVGRPRPLVSGDRDRLTQLAAHPARQRLRPLPGRHDGGRRRPRHGSDRRTDRGRPGTGHPGRRSRPRSSSRSPACRAWPATAPAGRASGWRSPAGS